MKQDFTLLFALLAVVVAIVYGEINRRALWREREGQREQQELAEEQLRLAHEQLKLAREQAKIRPKLEVSVGDPAIRYEENSNVCNARLLFLVTNAGRAVAHNVRGEFWSDTLDLELVGKTGFYAPSLSPAPIGQVSSPELLTAYRHRINARVYPAFSPIRIGYRIVCDEAVPPEEGVLELPPDHRPQVLSTKFPEE